MHSVLFVATNPNRSQDWDAWIGKIEAKLSPDGNEKRYAGSIVRLSENVWLINLAKSVEPLGWLTSFAQVHGVTYGLLPFDKEPTWLPSGFLPSNWKWKLS
jgi:hypothetical protein